MPESVANLTPSGAGRIRDWIFPGVISGAGQANFGVSQTSRSGSQESQGTVTGYGGGGNTAPSAVINGVPCVKIQCGPAATGLGFFFGQVTMSMFFPTTKSNIVPLVNDESAYRVVAALAGSGLAPNANTDIGIEFCGNSGATRISQDGASGWGLKFSGAALQFIAQGGPGGGVTLDITPAGFDITQWHVYDFRIIAANKNNDATLALLIDNVPANLGPTNSTWGGGGSHLPPQTLSAGVMSFRPSLIASAGNANFIACAFLRFMAAPSLAMCF